MLWILLKQQLLALLSSFRIGSRKNGVATRRSLGTTLLIFGLLGFCAVYFAVAIGGLFFVIFDGLRGSADAWVGFSVMGILVFLIDFFMTIFTAKSQLFEAKDNEFLLSLPIRPRDILLSRVLAILLTDYLFAFVVVIPVYVAWLMVNPFSIAGLMCFLLTTAVMPLLALSLSCLVGWILSIVTARAKNATILNTILSLLFFGGYMALCMGMQSYAQMLLTNASAVAGFIKTYLYPFYCLGDACANGSFLSAVIYAAIMILPFVVTCVILARSFLSLLTRKQGAAKSVYREERTRVKPLTQALLGRELRRLFSSTGYLINASLGIIMMPVFGVACFFLGDMIDAMSAGVGMDSRVLAPAIAIVAISLIGGMCFFTAPSVSLEGQTIYDLKALPLAGHNVLLAKLYMHLLFVLPMSLLTSLLCVIALPCSFAMGVLLFAVPPVFHTCFAAVGLVMNMMFPRFEWDNETAVVKQSLSVTFTMLINIFGGMLIAALGAALVLLVPAIPVWVSILMIAMIPAAVGAALITYVRYCGDRVFSNFG